MAGVCANGSCDLMFNEDMYGMMYQIIMMLIILSVYQEILVWSTVFQFQKNINHSHYFMLW